MQILYLTDQQVDYFLPLQYFIYFPIFSCKLLQTFFVDFMFYKKL